MARVILKKGIDVSKYQKTIDWKKVKESGVEFVMIRIGYRGNSTGVISADPYYLENIKGAIENKIEVGGYFFSTAISETEAIEEATYCIEQLKNYEVTLPVVFDLEGYNKPEYRTYILTKEQRTACCKAFIDTLIAEGYTTMLYGSRGYIRSKYDVNKLKYPLWVARYAGGYEKILSDDKYFPSMIGYDDRIAIWQYTSIGRVNGISGNVDMDYMYINISNKKEEPVNMVKPVDYKQYDSRWKNIKYDKSNGRSTIGSAGCGTTCSAMVLATLVDSNITPVETSAWSLANGYKYPSGGTYYSYFVNQFKVYNIPCKQLNTVNLRTQSRANSLLYHNEAKKALEDGNLVIACMGEGNWTSSGHYILLYKYENGYVYINDPASTKASRLKNTFDLVCKQVKYWWTIEVPNKKVEEVKTTYKITATNAVEDIAKMEELKSSLTQLGMNVQVEKFEEKVVIDPIPKINPYVKPTRILMFKSKIMNGEDVKWLQWELGITCDGLFGNGTKTALKKYQAKHGLTVDGICGAKTIASFSAN